MKLEVLLTFTTMPVDGESVELHDLGCVNGPDHIEIGEIRSETAAVVGWWEVTS